MSRPLEAEDLMDDLMHGEGILGSFFSIIWYKGLGKRMHKLIGINIPDTIIYLYSKPLHWFFSSKSGEIKKKSRGKLNSKHIEEQFLKNGTSVSNVKASYFMSRPSDAKTDAQHAQITYTYGNDLRKFLQEDKPNGVLQLFFDPKPEAAREGTAVRNSLVQTTWSPGCFFIEKRVNKYRLDTHKVPIEIRAATFDDYQNTETIPLVSDSVAASFQRVCQLIAEHVRVVFRYKLASLVLNFKIDKNDTIWLLWCSSIRIVSEENPSKALTATTVPPLQHYTKEQKERLVANGKRRENQRSKRRQLEDALRTAEESHQCPLCLHKYPGNELCVVLTKSILAALGGDQNSVESIPAPIRLISPGLDLTEYLEVRDKMSFLNSPVKVCCICLQGLVKCASGAGPRQLLGKKMLASSSRLKISYDHMPSTKHLSPLIKSGSIKNPSSLEYYKYDSRGLATKLGYATLRDQPVGCLGKAALDSYQLLSSEIKESLNKHTSSLIKIKVNGFEDIITPSTTPRQL